MERACVLLKDVFDHSLDEWEWIIPTGMFASWIALLGGTFTPPMAGELLVLWATMAALARRSLRPFALLAAAGAVALAVGAVRMFPAAAQPRPPRLRAPDDAAWVAGLKLWPRTGLEAAVPAQSQPALATSSALAR